MNPMLHSFNRRRFMSGSARLLGAAALSPLVANRAAAADYGDLAIQLSWVSNVEFAGEFFADANGYFKDAGFSSVKILPGGPSAPPSEIQLVQNKCLFGISLPDLTAAAVAEGAQVKAIASVYQRNPFCVISLAKNPILTPKDMIGKKIGVQAVNQTTWSVFLKMNDIDPAQINQVPVQFDPTPLAAGEVDGWMAFATNEPITLRQKGVDTAQFLFADHNYNIVAETIVVRQSSIDNERAKLKAMLKAEILGWQQALKDPAGAAKLAVEVYGKTLGLGIEEQTLQAMAQNELLISDETKKNGILTLTPEKIAATMKILQVSGIEQTAEQLFDMSLINEVYAENPSLKA